jgi:predicted dehydrogenase
MSTILDRRQLLRGAAITATAASYSRILGANDKMNLGLIGAGDRGQHDMSQFQLHKDVEVVAVCDVFSDKIDQVKSKAAPNAKPFRDHRKLVELKEVDMCLIATPDHWHTACAIDALNAGKDVYCEKPLTLTIEQGPPVVKAARVNNRICQVGMQQRSGKHYLQAKAEYFDTNKLGKITLARTWWHGNSFHLRRAPASLQTQPSNLDWAHFLGPLKWRDYDPQQYYNWRAYLDFGGGQVTDLFTHWIDVVHMFMGHDIPFAASAAGGVYQYKDGRTAPDTINVLLEYPQEYTATFEATLAPGITGAAIEMCGTEGRLWIDRSRFEYYPKGSGGGRRGAAQPPLTVQATNYPNTTDGLTYDHVMNFLECVKSRKLPNGDVLIGHRSAQASHLGNISYEQKRRINFDTTREEIQPL